MYICQITIVLLLFQFFFCGIFTMHLFGMSSAALTHSEKLFVFACWEFYNLQMGILII